MIYNVNKVQTLWQWQGNTNDINNQIKLQVNFTYSVVFLIPWMFLFQTYSRRNIWAQYSYYTNYFFQAFSICFYKLFN